MAASVAPGSPPGRPWFGPDADSCHCLWIEGSEACLRGTSPGEAFTGRTARLQFSDPFPYSEQHAHGHAYRDAPANLYANGHPNSHTHDDSHSHAYRAWVSCS